MIATEAWVLHKGPGAHNEGNEPGELRREVYLFPDISETEVLVEPIYGGWEANLGHAIERKPIDICRQRGEEKVVIGNSGVVRVLRTGAAVIHVKAGDYCILLPHSVTDRYGYVMKVLAYDAPHTMGLLARRAKFEAKHLVPVPPQTHFSLPQWASMVRYFSAWSNWHVTYKCLRSQLNDEACPAPYVWGWGGGVALAELQLAHHYGCQTAMIASSAGRLALIAQKGINAIDRTAFAHLSYDEAQFESDLAYKARYLEAEYLFLNIIKEKTDGEGVHIFIDNIGTPVYRATLLALAREGVITTCGWKHGMTISHLRAVECINRHIHVHTHAMTFDEGSAAMRFATEHNWLPDEAECTIYGWDEVPRLASDYEAGRIASYFPLFAVNPI